MQQPVQDALRDWYAAVGILKEFNSTLSLFDSALKIPTVEWHRKYLSAGKAKEATWHVAEKRETLAEAWTNSEVKECMQLDCMLYEHAVGVFR